MLGYRVPDPDEAMLISGGRGREGAPFKVITGRGAFVTPFLRHTNFLTLAMQEAEVEEQCVTQQGIALQVKAVIAFKVGNDEESITNAGTRFLSDQRQMPTLTGRIFAGHLRSIIGSMTVEDIIRERQKLAEQVLDGSKEEMAKLGLVVDSLQIQSIDDQGSGYIENMAAPHNAKIREAAVIAQAEADERAAEKQQASKRKQAEYQRETEVTEAGYRAETEKAQSEAAQAGPLARAKTEQAVVDEETRLQQRKAELKQEELQVEVVKPAEAEAESIKVRAKAEGEATELQAKAASSNDRVALDRMLIEQLPKIVEQASAGLARANISVLNGSDGLAELVGGLLTQGRQIYDSFRTAELGVQDGQVEHTGELPSQNRGSRASSAARANQSDADADDEQAGDA
jgi:flotillin